MRTSLSSSLSYLDMGDRARRLAIRKRLRSLTIVIGLLLLSALFTAVASAIPHISQLTQQDTYVISATFGLNSACIGGNCQPIHDYCNSLLSSTSINSSLVYSACTHIDVGAGLFYASIALNMLAIIAILSSARVMQPLSLSDPSLSRLKSAFAVAALGAIIQLSAMIVAFPVFTTEVFKTVEGSFSWSSSAQIFIVSIIFNIMALAGLMAITIGSIKEAKKIFNRSSVVKGLGRMSLDFKRKSFDFSQIIRGNQLNTGSTATETKVGVVVSPPSSAQTLESAENENIRNV